MVEKQIGFCPELLICPGETLEEVLDDRDMSRKELAIRSGVTEKHISQVINGKASITSDFASALESALDIDAEFWLNLQANYDLERIECSKKETVTKEELGISKQLNEIRKYLVKIGFVPDGTDNCENAILLRNYAKVTRLDAIPRLQHCAAYRISTHTNINPYVLFMWQKLCIDITAPRQSTFALDKKLLSESIPLIRSLVKLNINESIPQLKEIFDKCGITFAIVKNFKGAPVQGYIEKNETGGLILCMTIRNSYADIFWFTLFHEIAHILYDDIAKIYFDYTFEDNEIENRADQFASEVLIPTALYKRFVEEREFSLNAIRSFSKKADIPCFIVIGRLQKEKYIPYTWYSGEKLRYKWES